jgi:methionine sulfoxide reductase catalytic subunit
MQNMTRFKPNPEFQNLRHQITPRWAYMRRRSLLQGGSLGLLSWWAQWPFAQESKLKFKKNPEFQSVEEPRKLSKAELAYHYNNFYEFSLDKLDVEENAKKWNINSWKLEVGGLVNKARTLSLTDLTSAFDLEERIYRFRCVEAWSLVLPWIGFPLAALIKSVEPKPEAKYLKFVSLADKAVMPNITKLANYPWPYTEGLSMEEAMNPLALIAVGMFGEPLKKQNGAPVRLVVPWKYGFKSAKSLVKIEFVKEQPKNLWQELAPAEYGFYANVNPKVDHPRWSQASERVVDGSFFPKRIPTLMFNGYEKYVAKMYEKIDLKKFY